jgi:hypothetical protein
MHLSKVFIMNSISPLITPTHSTLLVFNNSKTCKFFSHGNYFLYSLQSLQWCKPKNSALVEFNLHVGWALFSFPTHDNWWWIPARALVQNSTGIKNFHGIIRYGLQGSFYMRNLFHNIYMVYSLNVHYWLLTAWGGFCINNITSQITSNFLI